MTILILILASFWVNAFATDSATQLDKNSINAGFDTLSYTKDDYKNLSMNSKANDNNQIQSVIIGYLATERAYVRKPEEYTQARGFVTATALNSNTVSYRKSESEYLKELNKLMNWTISRDCISFDNYRAQIEEQVATAKIVENYEYYINDGFDGESFRRREYTFEMKKELGDWKITSVKTNDPWENESTFAYTPIDVQGTIAEIANEMQQSKISKVGKPTRNDLEGIPANSTTNLNRWTYSASKAVTYAADHYRDTSNTVFGFTAGDNCQNFASQCVWAGLGGSGTSTAARPAVSASVAGSNGTNLWRRGVSTTYYPDDKYWLNWTWDNASGFANMIKNSQLTKEGPYGNTQYAGYFGYIDKGNVLEVDWNGSPARDTLDHAMFVTQVSGTSGSRTKSQVKIAAHTSPTNSAYQTLSSYTSMPTSAFAGNVYSTMNTDQKEIENITNSFFAKKEQTFLSNSNFNVAKYSNPMAVKNISKGSSAKLFEFEKKIRNDNISDISDEMFEYTIDAVTITGDKAVVKCYEYYEYTYKNDPIRSSRGTEYQITFVKNNDKWEIIEINTNNEIEGLLAQTDDFSNEDISSFDINAEFEEETGYHEEANPTKGVTHAYNRANAAQFALDNSSSSSRNDDYSEFFPAFTADCQNFASQCVWFGLGGTESTSAISNKNKPMITTTGRKWYCSSESDKTSSWTVVGDFRNYVVSESDGKEGIYGVRYAVGNAAKAQKGDIIQIRNSSGTWYHSYVINNVTGTYGSRTISNLYICAHTTNRRNENLSIVLGGDSANFRLIRINGTRY